MKQYLVKAGQLIDGKSDQIREDMGLLIEGDTILEVAELETFSTELEIIDYSDKTVMPGIFNCHVHIGMNPLDSLSARNEVETILYAYQCLGKYLRSGVTYVRNQGTKDFIDLKLKRMIEKKEIVGPSICASGPSICMTGGHGHRSGLESDGIDACKKSARFLLKNGVDTVKIMATGGVMTDGVEPGSEQLDYEEVEAIIHEAKKAGKLSSAHAQGTKGIENVVRAGITSVEHGIYLTDEIIEQMIQKDIYLVPTLSAVHFIIKNGLAGGIPEYAVRKAELVVDAHMDSFRRAYQKGVKIAMGTDAGTPFNLHENSWYEFKLMIEQGMKPMDALKSGTSVAAEMLQVDKRYGSLEKGKKADFIVLEENPLTNIETLENVIHVYKHGMQVK